MLSNMLKVINKSNHNKRKDLNKWRAAVLSVPNLMIWMQVKPTTWSYPAMMNSATPAFKNKLILKITCLTAPFARMM